jgi:dTDP-4-amino-4,6-dideoxygalactose transaminase
MDEIRAAYGLLNLKQVDTAIANRKATAEKYRNALKDVPGIRMLKDVEGVRHNYAYFPIFIDEKQYGMSRDALYAKLQEHNIYGRRYFYPLISTFSAYKGLESANPSNLPVAHKLANQVLCLPMFAGLDEESANRVIDVVRNKR